jgi:hypothetical protein
MLDIHDIKKGVTMRILKLVGIALLPAFVFGASRNAMAQASAPHQNQVWGLVRTQDHSTMNIWDKHVTIQVRPVVNDKPGDVVATSKLHRGHYRADMGNAPAGKYVVNLLPGSTGYGAGQTLIDYPGPGGNVHQSFTMVLGGAAIPAKN